MRAVVELAQMHLHGQGVARNPERALKLLTQAANEGHAGAMLQLSDFWLVGHGGTQDCQLAELWSRKAADRGLPMAMNLLGGIQEHENKSPEQALAWYRKAAEAGYGPGMFLLAQALEKNAGQHDEALQWYHRAADQSCGVALAELGTRYAEGNGVARDIDRAVKFLRKAAVMKDVDAAYQLGTILSEETKDPEAVKWLRQAGFENHSEASFRLANLYATGNLVKQDVDEARFWYRWSGTEDAMKALQELKASSDTTH